MLYRLRSVFRCIQHATAGAPPVADTQCSRKRSADINLDGFSIIKLGDFEEAEEYAYKSISLLEAIRAWCPLSRCESRILQLHSSLSNLYRGSDATQPPRAKTVVSTSRLSRLSSEHERGLCWTALESAKLDLAQKLEELQRTYDRT